MKQELPQVSAKETKTVLDYAVKSLTLKGDFVELGCYKGDTSVELGKILRTHNLTCPMPSEHYKQLYLYDSFEGIPEKTTEDNSAEGDHFKKGSLKVTKKFVSDRFRHLNLPMPKIKKAFFEDLTDKNIPDKIAFAFLDGDLYQSIKDSLRLVAPHMVSGGFVLIHDYQNPALPGVEKALDEWLSTHHNIKFSRSGSVAILQFSSQSRANFCFSPPFLIS